MSSPLPSTSSLWPVANLKLPERLMVVLQPVLGTFRSVQLAVVLLALLAAATIAGVVLPQEGNVDVAQIQKQFGPNYAFMKQLGMFGVFSSFWFITLEVLFFFNLLIGSFKWLKPAWLAATQVAYVPAAVMALKPAAHSLRVKAGADVQAALAQAQAVFKRHGYHVHVNTADGQLYATKGQWSRLGPCAAHLGILICLLAGVYGSFTGFKAIHMVAPGGQFQIPSSAMFATNTPQPWWFGQIPTWTIAVRDFRMEHYENHPDVVKNYYSGLDIVDGQGHLLKRQTISVNHPLSYDHISIYQASFAPSGRFKVTVDGQPRLLELNQAFNQRSISVNRLSDGRTLIMFPFFANQDPGVTQDHAVFFVLKKGEGDLPQGTMPETLKLLPGASGTLKGTHITYVEPEMQTGLQIKRAPEVPWMYLSFVIISIGTVMCFFSQRQVWLTLAPVDGDPSAGHAVMLHPKTNKARLSFRREMLAIEAALVARLTSANPSERSG
ncbi:MAG: cytochrome c biogenesis protein ResB [Cyanobacteria bacterium HKST-UBA04]|nr:cytochrome c biogenesis protein ResB [Cyanobacteria bacterium HKST-UBA04]MCA9841593.1 cytochrome c biogenesis protein ResB [Cyanobacteria bacterium HKST-UBA03]